MDKNSLLINKRSTTFKNVGDLRVLLLLYQYRNQNILDISASEFKEKLINENSPIQRWLREVSYGKCKISRVDAYGWEDYSSPFYFHYPDTVDVPQKLLQQYNINLFDYDLITIIENGPTSYNGLAGSITFPNGATIGASKVHFWDSPEHVKDITYLDGVSSTILHEWGHNFGLYHCRTFHFEYGDHFSIMGSSRWGHFDSFHKLQIGWLDSTSVLNIKESGTYTGELLYLQPSHIISNLRHHVDISPVPIQKSIRTEFII